MMIGNLGTCSSFLLPYSFYCKTKSPTGTMLYPEPEPICSTWCCVISKLNALTWVTDSNPG